MNFKILHKSYDFPKLTIDQHKSIENNRKRIISSHLDVSNIKAKIQNSQQKSQIINVYRHSKEEKHIVEVRGLNQDFLEDQDTFTYRQFSTHVTQISDFEKLRLLADVFQHMKKWFCIYGLVKFTQCVFLLRKLDEKKLYVEPNKAYILILYLNKKQTKESRLLSLEEKQSETIKQFLIMFGNDILQGEKLQFFRFSQFQLFLDQLLAYKSTELFSNNLFEQQRDQWQKNASITLSNTNTLNINHNLKGQKNVEKSMMVIEEMNSQYSSPKKFITASGFMDKGQSQKDVFLSGLNQIEVNRNQPVYRQEMIKKPNIFQRIIKSEVIKHRKSQIAGHKVRFNYISPQGGCRSLKKVTSMALIDIAKKENLPVRFKFTSPQHSSNKIYPFSSHQIDYQQNTLNENKRFTHKRQSTVDKMKQTATTLNTFGNNSSNYISQVSLQQVNLRISGSSDNMERLSYSPSKNKRQKINIDDKQGPKKYLTFTETRQRQHSHHQKPSTIKQHIEPLSSTIGQLNIFSGSIFDVAEVQQMKKSSQELRRISQEQKVPSQINSYSLNDMQNELDDLFGDDSSPVHHEAEIEMMIEELESLLAD